MSRWLLDLLSDAWDALRREHRQEKYPTVAEACAETINKYAPGGPVTAPHMTADRQPEGYASSLTAGYWMLVYPECCPPLALDLPVGAVRALYVCPSCGTRWQGTVNGGWALDQNDRRLGGEWVRMEVDGAGADWTEGDGGWAV